MSELIGAAETRAGDDLLARLTDDFLRRHRAGEHPSIDEYAGKHPALANRIRDVFPAILAMEHSGTGATLDPAPITERVGATIGRYKLLEHIGEGGFGVVYMAEQQLPVRRKVALKVLKPGMDSRQVLARFEAERQALAIMDHPNIAKVFDGGMTDSGRPYFVMELVKGVPITEFCDQQQLATRQRLELFAHVCHAVQHAHQKGIIHRDIKPTNLLVIMHDATPLVKVIDFGVAKALGQELTEKTLFTGVAQLLGTPLYMSPEQAGQSALDVDTRSDIYSLGVLLYELLTGSTPFDKERFKKAAHDEIRRIIREEEPPTPSTRLSESKDALASISARRKTEPARLTRLVRGELDWIVMKALEKDRNRRYETANGFAMDVQRYLADEPVLACPPSTIYRLKKFVRRNKAPVITAAIVLLTLTGGIVGTSMGLVRTERARRAEAERAEGERRAKERAEANFDLANQAVEEYLSAVTDDPDLKRADFHNLRKKLLESAIPFFEKLTAQNSGDPAVEARRGGAYRRLAWVRHMLGENEAAIRDAQASRAVFERLAADFPTVRAHRQSLGISLTSLGFFLDHGGRRADAEAIGRQASATWEKLAAEAPDDAAYREGLGRALLNLGDVLAYLGKRGDAEATYHRALEIQQKLAAQLPNRPAIREQLASSYNGLALLFRNSGKTEDAEVAYRRAVALQEKLVAEFPDDPDYRLRLTGIHENFPLYSAKSQDAERLHREGVAVSEKAAAEFPSVPWNRRNLAAGYINLGTVLDDLGKREEAEEVYRRAIDIQQKLVDEVPSVPIYRRELSVSYNNLSILLADQGKRADAEAAFRQCIAMQEKLAAEFPNAPVHAFDLTGSYCNLGRFVYDDNPEAALPWFDKAIAMLEPILVKDPRLVDTREILCGGHEGRARALDALNRHDEAARDWRRALEYDDGDLKPAFQLRALRYQKDAAGCVAAAAAYDALKPTDPHGLYTAATNRAICAEVIPQDPRTSAADAARLTREQADLAMAWLHQAVATGYADLARLRQDKDLDALREREDFRALEAALEEKSR